MGWQQDPQELPAQVQESQHTDFPEETRGETGSSAARLRTAGSWAAATLEVCPGGGSPATASGIWQEQGKATSA